MRFMIRRIRQTGLVLAGLIVIFLCFSISAGADSSTALWPEVKGASNSSGKLLAIGLFEYARMKGSYEDSDI